MPNFYLPFGVLLGIITWFAVHCFSSVHCTQLIVQLQCTLETLNMWLQRRCELLFTIRNNQIFHILLNNFIWYLLITVKHPWFSPLIWRNIAVFQRRSVDFKTIHSRVLTVSFFCCYGIHLWRHEVDWDYDIIADVDNGWGECILSIGVRFMHGMSAWIHVLFCHIFLSILYSMLYLINSYAMYIT